MPDWQARSRAVCSVVRSATPASVSAVIAFEVGKDEFRGVGFGVDVEDADDSPGKIPVYAGNVTCIVGCHSLADTLRRYSTVMSGSAWDVTYLLR